MHVCCNEHLIVITLFNVSVGIALQCKLHYDNYCYLLQAIQAHLFSANHLFMSILNFPILFDTFMSSGREFQILGPKNLRDLIP